LQHEDLVQAFVRPERAEAVAQADIDAGEEEGVGEQEIFVRIYHLAGRDA
jgi:hypothetical protein